MSYLLQRTLNTATARATNYHLIHYLADNIIHHMLETSCLVIPISWHQAVSNTHTAT